jgi:AcrR family transcriptional regulator
VPTGTASNYFRTREALIGGLVDRIGERLAPSSEFVEQHAGLPPSRELFADYLRNIVDRLMAEPDVTTALFELRLESRRRPEVAGVLLAWQRAGFDGDVAFNEQAGLPGGRAEIALFHYAMDGLLLDLLTGRIAPDLDVDKSVDALVRGLLPEG